MRLLLVELSRLRSRRAIVLLVVAGALLTAFIAGSSIWETRPISQADRVAAQVQADREAQRPYVQREIDRCEKNPRRYFGPQADAAECAESITPRAEWFLYRSTLSLSEERRDSGIAVLLLVCALMIIVGTTFAGADWNSGSMSNQMLFEPRRLKVWLAKAGAVFLGTLLATAVIVAGFWLALYLFAESRGIETGSTVQADIRWMVARGVMLAAVGATGGYALTMLLRSTVGTLALMFAYSVGGEALTASLPIAGIGRWSLSNNVFAWLRDGHSYYDESIPCPPTRDFCEQMATLTLGDSVPYLGVMVLVVVAASMVLFHRRDIP